MNSEKQDEAGCLAKELKRECDALMGEGWFKNPTLMYDYKRSAPKNHWPPEFIALWDKLGFELAWLEEAIDASEHDKAWRGGVGTITANVPTEPWEPRPTGLLP